MSADRRPLRFWQPFNDWWRAELDKQGRRPTAAEIVSWYNGHAQEVWGDDAPTIQETRVHAKCLRSNAAVREYFREYRAKKRNQHSGHGYDEDDSHEGADDDYEHAGAAALFPPLDASHLAAGLHSNPLGKDGLSSRGGAFNGTGLPGSGMGCGLLGSGLLGGHALANPGNYLPGMQAGMQAAWPGGVQGLCIDPVQQQQDLVRGYMLVQAQHSAAIQQQLALAALAAQHSAALQAAAASPGLALLAAGADALNGGAQVGGQPQVQQNQQVQALARRASATGVEQLHGKGCAAASGQGLDGYAALPNMGGVEGLDAHALERKRRRHTTSCLPEVPPVARAPSAPAALPSVDEVRVAAVVPGSVEPEHAASHSHEGCCNNGPAKCEAQAHTPSPSVVGCEDGAHAESPAKRQCVASVGGSTGAADGNGAAPAAAEHSGPAAGQAKEGSVGNDGLVAQLPHLQLGSMPGLPTIHAATAEAAQAHEHVHVRPPGVEALDNCCLSGPCKGHCVAAGMGKVGLDAAMFAVPGLMGPPAGLPSVAQNGSPAPESGAEDVSALRALSHEQLVQEVVMLRKLLRLTKAASEGPAHSLSQATSTDTTAALRAAVQPSDDGTAAFLSVLSQLRQQVGV